MTQGQAWHGLQAISRVTGVSERTLLEWHRSHSFPMRRQDGDWSLTADDLEAWARARVRAEREHA